MAAHGGMVTRRRLADRRLDHEWPAELRELWQAAQHLRLAVDTLEAVGDDEREGMPVAYDRVIAAADFAATALLRVEELAAPLLREREG